MNTLSAAMARLHDDEDDDDHNRAAQGKRKPGLVVNVQGQKVNDELAPMTPMRGLKKSVGICSSTSRTPAVRTPTCRTPGGGAPAASTSASMTQPSHAPPTMFSHEEADAPFVSDMAIVDDPELEELGHQIEQGRRSLELPQRKPLDRGTGVRGLLDRRRSLEHSDSAGQLSAFGPAHSSSEVPTDEELRTESMTLVDGSAPLGATFAAMILMSRGREDILLQPSVLSLQHAGKVIRVHLGTNKGYDPLKEVKKDYNQDSMIAWARLGQAANYSFFAVCDGHGSCGHHVSRYVREFLPQQIIRGLGMFERAMADGRTRQATETKANEMLHQILGDCFETVDAACHAHTQINDRNSGSTAITVTFVGDTLHIGNVGDSRCILGRYNPSSKEIEAVPLSRDNKPYVAEELARIRAAGGRVFPIPGDPLKIPRVWLKEKQTPGLATSRAFGDFQVKSCGVIARPTWETHKVTENDKFIVLASDGVWDVYTDEEVVELVYKYEVRREKNKVPKMLQQKKVRDVNVAEKLVRSAQQRWEIEDPTQVVDDTTAAIIFF